MVIDKIYRTLDMMPDHELRLMKIWINILQNAGLTENDNLIISIRNWEAGRQAFQDNKFQEAVMAYNAAMRDAKQSGSLGVPVHLRNAPTKLMKSLDYGKEYRYAHNEPEAYAAGENYFPEQLMGARYYQPVDRGLEIKIKEKLRHLQELDKGD